MRLTRNLMILVFLVLNILIIACHKKVDNPVLAKFNGSVVLQNEYVDHYLLSTQYKPQQFPTEENLKEIIVLKAMEKIAVIEAKARAIDNDSSYQENATENKNKILFYRYMRQEIIDSIITDSLIYKFYFEFTPQYNMRYIMRPVLRSSTEEFAISQKDTIEFVYNLLKSGQKFEKLAEKYSQDITTNKKGGDLGFVIRESLGDAKLRAVMDTLEDFSYSKPFRGYEGYYILYKGEKRQVPVPLFNKVRDKIWNTLYRTRRHLIKQAVEKRFNNIASKYQYQVNENVIENVKKKAGGDAESSEFQLLDFKKLSEEDMAQELASYKNGSISVSELFKDRKRAPDNMHDFNDRLTAISQQHILAQHARELGIQNTPEMKKQIEDLQNSILRSIFYQKVVKDKAQAMVDSIREIQGDEIKPDELKSFIQKKRFEFEKKLKAEFEEKMKAKYQFEFVTKNFRNALDEAHKRKLEQNEERER